MRSAMTLPPLPGLRPLLPFFRSVSSSHHTPAMRLASLLIIGVALAGLASTAQGEPSPPPYSQTLLIYVAKGAPNACGQGCDRWIAIEGKFDGGAAARFRRFLRGIGDAPLPFYFHSPGGDVSASLTIGRMLRARKATVRVGRTLLAACKPGAQIDEECLKIKSGREVLAEIATAGAMCNSACVYTLLGGTTREIAPDTVLAVHNSKLTVSFRGHPTSQQRAAAVSRQWDNANHERKAYVAAMGIDGGLLDLIQTVKFEDLHVLTRAELYRFKIDPRTAIETAWTEVPASPPFIRKVAVVKTDDAPSFARREWLVGCQRKDRVGLIFARELDAKAPTTTSVALTGGGETAPILLAWTKRAGSSEFWSAAVAVDALTKIFASPQLQVKETSLAEDGKSSGASFAFDGRGFEDAFVRLFASCQTQRDSRSGADQPKN